jgi:hypothetical protein
MSRGSSFWPLFLGIVSLTIFSVADLVVGQPFPRLFAGIYLILVLLGLLPFARTVPRQVKEGSALFPGGEPVNMQYVDGVIQLNIGGRTSRIELRRYTAIKRKGDFVFFFQNPTGPIRVAPSCVFPEDLLREMQSLVGQNPPRDATNRGA